MDASRPVLGPSYGEADGGFGKDGQGNDLRSSRWGCSVVPVESHGTKAELTGVTSSKVARRVLPRGGADGRAVT